MTDEQAMTDEQTMTDEQAMTDGTGNDQWIAGRGICRDDRVIAGVGFLNDEPPAKFTY